MNWFERLTGFRETSYDDTRAKLKVEGDRLQSLINGDTYGIGELELVPLHALRERVKSGGGLPGQIKVSVVTGDVRQMHQSPGNAGALFQVASQFNLLEMVSPAVTPEQGVTCYQNDHTQGPACAIAAGAATIYRNYFAPIGGSDGQTAERQLDGLANLGRALGSALNQPVKALWENAKRLRIVHPRWARRHCGVPRRRCSRSRLMFCAASCASGFTATWKSRMSRGNIGPGFTGLLLGLTSGLYLCSALILGSICVIGSASGLRSHDVSRRVECTTGRVERRSADAARRRSLRQSRRLDLCCYAASLRDDGGFELDVRLVSYGTPSRTMLHLATEFGRD